MFLDFEAGDPKKELLAPEQPQSADEANYWQIEAGPAKAEYPLNTSQSLFLQDVVKDPLKFGYTGSKTDVLKMRIAAIYLEEKSSAELVKRGPQYVKMLYKAEAQTVNFYTNQLISTGISAEEIGEHSLISTLGFQMGLLRIYHPDKDLVREVHTRFIEAQYGPIVKLLQEQAAAISDEQAEWEKSHGLLAISELDNNHLRELFSPSADRAAIAMLFRNTITPEELALKIGLPRIMAAVAISNLVHFGILKRSAQGNTLTASENIKNAPLPIKLIATCLGRLLNSKKFIREAGK